jgi:hypothetical protein
MIRERPCLAGSAELPRRVGPEKCPLVELLEGAPELRLRVHDDGPYQATGSLIVSMPRWGCHGKPGR